MRLEPDLARTLVGIGDAHFSGSTTSPNYRRFANERGKHYQDRVLARGNPAGVLHVGDLTEWGLPEEHSEVAAGWWADWPVPKIICPGNHDINNIAPDPVGDTLPQWEARYGARTQVLDTTYFRAVSCLWTNNYWNGAAYVDQPGAREGLNTAEGYALLRDTINASAKPTALAFHYATQGTVPGTGPPATGATITDAAQTNVKNLIAACPNLQLILNGHTHTEPWNASWWWRWTDSRVYGSDGRGVVCHNLGATTYIPGMPTYNEERGPLCAYYFTFYDGHLETRILDVKNDAWMPRSYGFKRVERYVYT